MENGMHVFVDLGCVSTVISTHLRLATRCNWPLLEVIKILMKPVFPILSVTRLYSTTLQMISTSVLDKINYQETGNVSILPGNSSLQIVP
ncbi:hypothetical protein D3C87_1494570 [compost metagenome]